MSIEHRFASENYVTESITTFKADVDSKFENL